MSQPPRCHASVLAAFGRFASDVSHLSQPVTVSLSRMGGSLYTPYCSAISLSSLSLERERERMVTKGVGARNHSVFPVTNIVPMLVNARGNSVRPWCRVGAPVFSKDLS
jgi:hypothetical protein